MRQVFVILFALMFSFHGANAQTSNDKYDVWGHFVFDPQVTAGIKQHNVTPLTYGINIGYEFVPRLYAFVRAEEVFGLYEKDDVRTFAKSSNLGGGMGFRLLGGRELKATGATKDGLDLRLSAGASVGKASWKQTFYDVNLQYYLRGSRYAFTPTISLGYRFTDSRTNNMLDQHTVYGSIGFRF